VPVVVAVTIFASTICCIVSSRRRQNRGPLTAYNPSYGQPSQWTGPVYGGGGRKEDGGAGGNAVWADNGAQHQHLCGAPPGYGKWVNVEAGHRSNWGSHAHHTRDHSGGMSGGHGGHFGGHTHL
jgi:hypothetical protein